MAITVRSGLSVLFTFCALAPLASFAQTTPFNLPSQALAESLKAIGSQTNINVMVAPTLVDGRQAPALKQQLSTRDALARVLAGTGLEYRFVNDQTVVIREKTAAPAAVSDQKRSTTGTPQDASKEDGTKNSSQDFRVAQVDQGKTTSDSSIEKQDGEPVSLKNPVQLEEIVVTGSHIRGIENKTNPVIVIDQAQIEQSGYSSTQDLFRSLPQNFSSGNTTQDGFLTANGGENFNFSSGINLRGLGANSTLVLLNGHRMAPDVLGTVVDVSSIPLAAIDRIEILTDGSSAVYGSDAVGGVVNIILKKDYQGADTLVRYGSVTDGSRNEETIGQTFGTNWSGGNVTGTLQFQNQSALPSSDRDFASGLPSPSDLLPNDHIYAGTLNARQKITDQTQVYSDILWSKRHFNEYLSADEGGLGIDTEDNDGDSNTLNIASGVRYDFSSKWSVELNGLYADQKSNNLSDTRGLYPSSIVESEKFNEKSADVLLNGKFWATPAGDAGVAVGASYRREDSRYTEYEDGAFGGGIRPSRTVKAYYGEIYLPLVGPQNSKPLLRALDISVAVRNDKYSDFGSTTNPRAGLRWSPATGFSLRGSYGTSFRAPAEAELLAGLYPSVGIQSLANPNGPGTVPAIVYDGKSNLTAEKAKSIDIGVEYQPSDAKGTSLSLNYYDIRYSDRIIQVFPPLNALQSPGVYGQLITNLPSNAAAQALVDAAIAAGASYYDEVGTGTAGVRYAYNASLANASIVRQSGLDLIATWARSFSAGSLVTQFNGTFTDKIDTAYTAGASFANLVGTYGNPPKWRFRTTASWATKGWELNGAVVFVGSYLNTDAIGTPTVASWTTIDLGARLHVEEYLKGSEWRGVTLGLSALNILNRDPPFIASSTGAPITYDPYNANPLGRFLALELRKEW